MTFCKTALFCWNTGNGAVHTLESFNHQNVAADLFVIYLFNYLLNNWTYLCAANGHCQQEQHSHTWRHLEGWEESQDGRMHARTHARTHLVASHSSFSPGWESLKLKLYRISHLTISLGEEKSGRSCFVCRSRGECEGRPWAGEMWRALRNSLRPSPPAPLIPPHYFHRGQWGGRFRRRADEGGA